MTDWNQIRTDKHWGSYDNPNYGDLTYDSGNEHWTPDAGEQAMLRERGDWAAGYRPKQVRINFTGGTCIGINIYKKTNGGFTPTGVGIIRSGEPVEVIEYDGDIWGIGFRARSDESVVITNIAFSEDVYTGEAYAGSLAEEEEWSSFIWNDYIIPTGQYDYKPLIRQIAVYRGDPHFLITNYVNADLMYGLKYSNGSWQRISDNSVDSDDIDNPSSFIDNYTIYYDYSLSQLGLMVDERGISYVLQYIKDSLTHRVRAYTDFNVESDIVRSSSGGSFDYGWAEIQEGLVTSNDDGDDYLLPDLGSWPDEGQVAKHGEYPSMAIDNNGRLFIVYTGYDRTQLRYMAHYWNDPLTGNYLGSVYPAVQCCLIIEDTTDANHRFSHSIVAVDSNNVIHIIYVHQEGVGVYNFKHVKNEDGVWNSPATITTESDYTNRFLADGQLLVDSNDDLHYFHLDYSFPTYLLRHYKYSGGSWSLFETINISAKYSVSYNPIRKIIIDKRDKFHVFYKGTPSGGGYTVIRLTNESGNWKQKKVVIAQLPSNWGPPNGDISYTAAYDYDSDTIFLAGLNINNDEFGFTSFTLSEALEESVSSNSSLSESESSSADSKSSFSSESSSESSESHSSVSESSSSESKDSKSSDSSSSESSSSSADSKSSSLSSHSSQSWDDPCAAWSGSFVSYLGKNTSDYVWPKYDSDPTAMFDQEGFGSVAFNGTVSADFLWYETAPMSFGNKWVEAEIEVAKVAVRLRITGPDSQYTKGMTDFDIVASNTGDFTGEEVVLIRVRGITYSTPDQQFSYNIKNSTAYKYYRVIPWRTQDVTPTWQYCRFELIELFECYDDSSSSESSISSSSSMSISSDSIASPSSESFDLVGLYDLCQNTNVSSSSSSRSESSLSGQALGWP
jgi:hypothetical protein